MTSSDPSRVRGGKQPRHSIDNHVTIYFANSLEFGEDVRHVTSSKRLLSNCSLRFKDLFKTTTQRVITFDMVLPEETAKETMWQCLEWLVAFFKLRDPPIIKNPIFLWEFGRRIGCFKLQDSIMNDICKHIRDIRSLGTAIAFAVEDLRWLFDRSLEDFEHYTHNKLMRFVLDCICARGGECPTLAQIHVEGGRLSVAVAEQMLLHYVRLYEAPEEPTTEFDPVHPSNRHRYLVIEKLVPAQEATEGGDSESNDDDQNRRVDIHSLAAVNRLPIGELYLDRVSVIRRYRLSGVDGRGRS